MKRPAELDRADELLTEGAEQIARAAAATIGGQGVQPVELSCFAKSLKHVGAAIRLIETVDYDGERPRMARPAVTDERFGRRP